MMDACLHNVYDVPRAKQIFENMRANKPGDPLLDVRVFNRFLEAYVDMATTKGNDDSKFWVKAAWELFNVMHNGVENVSPNVGTYAVMLTAWIRFVHWCAFSFSPCAKHTMRVDSIQRRLI